MGEEIFRREPHITEKSAKLLEELLLAHKEKIAKLQEQIDAPQEEIRHEQESLAAVEEELNRRSVE